MLANVFYILRKINGNENAKEQIKYLRSLVEIVPITGKAVDMALNSDLNDFEDALQYYATKEQNLQGIITRNVKDYKIKDMPIQTSEEFVKTNSALFETAKNYLPNS